MPNWCNNYIVITGSKEKISLLTKVIEDVPKQKSDESIVFETLIGTQPTITKEEHEKGGWYEANKDWFGTKWDVSYNDCQFEFGEEQITMSPLTAWSPPIQFASNLCRMYGVSVEMTYDECACDFYGRTTVDENGDYSEEDYSYNEGAYHFDDEYFWESVIQNDMEYAMEENKSVEEFVEDYPYVTPEDKEEIRKVYTEFLEENKTDNNE